MNVASISRVGGNFDKKDEVHPLLSTPDVSPLVFLIVSFIYIVPFVYFRF